MQYEFRWILYFSGTPHNSVLSPNTKNIVNRNGEFLFYINEAVAVDSSGEILKAKGTPAFDGDDLIEYSQKGMTDDEKAFHKVMAIMFPIRNALMYDIAELNESDWNELVTELRLNGIKDKTYTGGPTPKDNYYGREGIFNLAKNPNGRNIHHDVMKFLEESGIYLLCHFTSNDFNQMLKDTHPENHNPCEEARAGSDLEDEPSKIDSSLDSVKSQLGNEFLRNVWMCDESPILVDDYTTGNNDAHRCKVNIEFTREDVVIRTKGIPNHDFESMTGCCAREQDKVYKIPINPIF